MNIYELNIDGKTFHLGDDNGFLVYEGVALKHDTFYIVCPYGIGDTLYAASLAESLKSFRSLSNICFIVKKSHSQIPDWFDYIDEKIVSDEIVNTLNLFSIFLGKWEMKNYLYGHFRKDTNGAILSEYGDCEVKNMIYRYKKLVFHLPAESILEEPKILPDELLFQKLMTTYNLDSQSIILMPYANSAALLSEHFWEILANLLIDLGFTVYTNVKGSEELAIPGTTALRADLATMAAICEFCRLVISFRSGICDVLAFTETNLIVINGSEYHLNEWNLKYATNRNNIHSFLASDNTIIPTILDILNYS